MKTALYIRVSTAGQDAESQVRELRAYAEHQGWEIVEAYRDGAKTGRPALNRMVTDARAGKFDCLLVWKLGWFGKSLVDCLSNIRTLEENAVRFIAVNQGLDTTPVIRRLVSCSTSSRRLRNSSGR